MEDIEICARLKRQSRPLCLRHKAITSGRRWDEYGTWRTIGLMWRLRWAYWRGEQPRSEERRVGKECRCGGAQYDLKKTKRKKRRDGEVASERVVESAADGE